MAGKTVLHVEIRFYPIAERRLLVLAVLDIGLIDKIAELKNELEKREKETLDYDLFRALLIEKIGTIKKLQISASDDLGKWSGGRPLLAVDGSANKTGASFPYTICFLQAYAKSSRGGGVAKADFFTPLLYNDYQALDKFANENDTGHDHAFNMYMERKLCELEIDSALKALKKYSPFLVIFDGGFSRFARYAPKLWDQYRRESLDREIVSVGVIEEAASSSLYRILYPYLGTSPMRTMPVYDRELLYGMLDRGECLFPNTAMKLKREYYTVFTRFSNVPQAIACDFFREQVKDTGKIMDYLYTISPEGSRGIPLFLDVVDAEARLSDRDLRLLLESNLSAETLERFYRTNRERRDF